jgi:hypothetical protein
MFSVYQHRGLNRFHRGHAAYILLYTNKGCNDQRSQATTSSVSGLKKILKNHTFKQSLLSFAKNSSDELGTGNTRHLRKSIVNNLLIFVTVHSDYL